MGVSSAVEVEINIVSGSRNSLHHHHYIFERRSMTTPSRPAYDQLTGDSAVLSVEVRDAKLEYCDNKVEESVILFLHGGLTDLRVWKPHREIIGDRYRTIAYSQRYHGRGAWSADWPSYGVNTHSLDLIEFIAAVAAPVHLVAWSYAAHIAFDAALRRPDLFRSLFVYEPGFATYVSDQAEQSAAQEDAMAAFGPAFLAAGSGDVENALKLLVDASGQMSGYFDSQPSAVKALQIDNARTIPELLFRQEPPPHISCAQLASLEVPTLVAHGANSRPMYSIVSKAAQSCIGGAEHLVIPGRNHMWPDEDPRGFVDALLRFINVHDAD